MEYNDFVRPGKSSCLPIRTALTTDTTNPVFGLNMTIATEAETWGGVKSLFR